MNHTRNGARPSGPEVLRFDSLPKHESLSQLFDFPLTSDCHTKAAAMCHGPCLDQDGRWREDQIDVASCAGQAATRTGCCP